MILIKSQRANTLLQNPRFESPEVLPGMRRFPGDEVVLWVGIQWEGKIVKNLSFHGELEPYQKIILESMASLVLGKPLNLLEALTLRECEAFQRDKNSQVAIEGLTAEDEKLFKKIFSWVRAWPQVEAPKEYRFQSQNGGFRRLSLAEKIRELRAFLNSPEILKLYQNHRRPELVDLEDLTAFVEAPYGTEEERSLFEELHALGVETFGEENLNFIPDA